MKTCLSIYLIENGCMHVALYALFFCVMWRAEREQEIAQNRVHEAAASCSVLCGGPSSWRDPRSRIPYVVMIITKPVTPNSAGNVLEHIFRHIYVETSANIDSTLSRSSSKHFQDLQLLLFSKVRRLLRPGHCHDL